MNLDDESQLSAFLDDELDPGDRQAVAWAVESSPPQARQLAELQAAQALIQGLDRPAIPRDLAAAILVELDHAGRGRPRRSRTAAARLAASLVGVGSVAASLMLAIIILHRTLHQAPASGLFADGGNPSRTHPFDDTLKSFDIQSPAAPSSPPAWDASALPAAAPPPAVLADRAPAPPAEATPPREPEPARPEQVEALLGHRRVCRALIVADALEPASARVWAFLKADKAREPDFGRITLARGIVIDPDQPGEAEVYSLVIGAKELDPFLGRLRHAFPAMQAGTAIEPTLVTQLSEVGQAVVFADVRPSRLGSPPRGVQALVAARGAAGNEPVLRSALVPVDPAGGFLAGLPGDFADEGRSRRAEAPARAAEPPAAVGKGGEPAASAGPGGADEPVSVLVWVTRAARP